MGSYLSDIVQWLLETHTSTQRLTIIEDSRNIEVSVSGITSAIAALTEDSACYEPSPNAIEILPVADNRNHSYASGLKSPEEGIEPYVRTQGASLHIHALIAN